MKKGFWGEESQQVWEENNEGLGENNYSALYIIYIIIYNAFYVYVCVYL